MELTLFFFKDVDDELVMHSKSDNIEFMPYHNANEVVNELSRSLLSRYQIGFETSMRGSDFIFDSVQLLYYKCHKINFKRGGGSYVDSADWIKNKIAAKNPKNEWCFQYAATAALNHEEFKRSTIKNIKC